MTLMIFEKLSELLMEGFESLQYIAPRVGLPTEIRKEEISARHILHLQQKIAKHRRTMC